jgi:hypothetical protein
MNLAWSALIVVAASSAAVIALLLVRRRAPDGSYFHDGDRASGVFGVLATGFSVFLGFVVFLAFTSYDNSRSGAEQEALTVVQQFETAHLLPPGVGRQLGDELTCYGRSVIHYEWPRMEAGSQGDAVNPWGVALFRTLRTAQPRSAPEQAAYSKWLDQTSDREQGRSDRIHAAEGVIPRPLWLVLFVIAGLIFVFMLFFADSGERAVVQGMLIGTVVAVIAATLLVIGFLNHPFHPGAGSLRPVAMQRTLRILDQERRIAQQTGSLPCDASGTATT